MSLTGKVALITGGSRGIGLAIAQRLQQQGAAVVVTGTNAGALADAQKALSAGRALAVRADVRKYDEIAGAIAQAESAFGGLDILINNAGVGRFKPVTETSVDDWHAVIDTNLTGVFYGCHAALPRLKARGGGWIINIS